MCCPFCETDSIFTGNPPSVSHLQFELQDKDVLIQIHMDKNNTLLICSHSPQFRMGNQPDKAQSVVQNVDPWVGPWCCILVFRCLMFQFNNTFFHLFPNILTVHFYVFSPSIEDLIIWNMNSCRIFTP